MKAAALLAACLLLFGACRERAYIDGLLKSHGGKLTAAARHADMDLKNFSDKMQRYGLRRSAAPEPPA